MDSTPTKLPIMNSLSPMGNGRSPHAVGTNFSGLLEGGRSSHVVCESRSSKPEINKLSIFV
jgi:hypothetical protein